jgi:hypothetical protein
MPFAIAFHEQIAMDRLVSYYTAIHTSAFETQPTICSNCSLTFAVVLVNRADANNPMYVEELRTEIEKDCDAGIHRDEYEWPPVQQSTEEIMSDS